MFNFLPLSHLLEIQLLINFTNDYLVGGDKRYKQGMIGNMQSLAHLIFSHWPSLELGVSC